MQMSLVPLVMEGQSDPLVGRLRQALNIPGDLVLDRPLVEVVRGVQRARGLTDHGQLDEQTLAVFDITPL